MRSVSLPTRCSALGLTLAIRVGDSAPAAVPESLWRDAELMERPTRVAVLPLAPAAHRLVLGCFGDYTVDVPAGTVEVHCPPEQGITIHDVLAGPVLLHALATRGIHALHASAFQVPDGRILAFTADSGTGKSSLAARAHARGWTRVADDLLALRIEDGRLRVLPALRQPKLVAAEQPGRQLPASVPLSALAALRRARGPARRIPMDAASALRLALSATVATRVYAPASLAAHLHFVGQVAGWVADGTVDAATIELPDQPGDIDGALDAVLDVCSGPSPAQPIRCP